MKMWAIAYKHEEDVWYDFEIEGNGYDLDPSCLLPTKKLAEEIIKNVLCDDYIPVEIDIKRLTEKGIRFYEFDSPKEWQDDYETEE